MSKDDGGPAYPVAFTTTPLKGMSLRDYFAAQAMTALLSNDKCNPFHQFDFNAFFWAGKAYKIADAMLAEREKQQ